MYVFKIDVKW